MMRRKKRERALRQQKRRRPIKLIAILLIVLLASIVGFAAWRSTRPDAPTVQREEERTFEIPCDWKDNTLCEFITKWKASNEYRFISRSTTAGVTTTTTYEYDLNDPVKIYTKVDGPGGYEVISIGNTIYTKAGGTWWKETVNNQETTPSGSDSQAADEKSKDLPDEPTNYTRVGKEACGDLQCYKYEIKDPYVPDVQQFVWFDDQEHRLRKLSFVTVDNVTEQIFEYTDIDIREPSESQDIPPGQKIVPGQAQPTPG